MNFHKSDYFKPLEDCSKEENEDGVSEYDTMIAISRMKNEVFTEAELQKEIAQVVVNKVLNSLVDKGLVTASWDPEQNAIVFNLV